MSASLQTARLLCDIGEWFHFTVRQLNIDLVIGECLSQTRALFAVGFNFFGLRLDLMESNFFISLIVDIEKFNNCN